MSKAFMLVFSLYNTKEKKEREQNWQRKD